MDKCLILGCGPSLSQITRDQIVDLKKDHYIFAIKQAYTAFPDLVDYHFYNDNNFMLYDHHPVVKVIVEVPHNHVVPQVVKGSSRLFFVDNTSFEKSLSYTHDFDSWTIDASPHIRPWGPGIMYELVFFYAHFLGVKEIKTVGWDLGPKNSKTRDHFYTSPVYNKAAPLCDKEAAKEIELTLGFYRWLKKQRIDLSICSSGSYAHQDIPRKSL